MHDACSHSLPLIVCFFFFSFFIISLSLSLFEISSRNSSLTYVGLQCSFDSTGSPCSECSLQGSECIVDEAADKRRKAAGKRLQEELQLYQDTLKVAQEQIKVLQQELRDTKYEFSMMLMEKERAIDATSTFLEKLLGVLRKNDSAAFSALIGTIRSGANNVQIMGVLDQLMP